MILPILRAFNITDGTVKLHVKSILRKLGIRSRVEAAVLAVEHGLGRKNPAKTKKAGVPGLFSFCSSGKYQLGADGRNQSSFSRSFTTSPMIISVSGKRTWFRAFGLSG